MKHYPAVFLLLPICAVSFGQSSLTSSSSAAAPAARVDPPYSVTSSGPNHNSWQRITYEKLPSGEVVPHVLGEYTELQTGLNFWGGKQWTPSQERIRILRDGTGVADQGQHKAWFPSDIYSGVITMALPDASAKPIRSQVVGLSYSDGHNSVLIAAVTNSVGQLLPTGNQIIYANCFSGVTASLRYTYRKDSFEQDVLLESQLPSPGRFGLSDAAYLEVVTEFMDATPTVVQQAQISGSQTDDQDLDFGTMKMGRGRAFVLDSDQDAAGVAVIKDWAQVSGRQFLFEQVPLSQIEQMVKSLPAPRQSSIKTKPTFLRTARGRPTLPKARLAQTGTNVIRMAEVKIQPGTLVLDYSTINTSLTNYTFKGDTTYYLSGNVSLFGTNNLFEAGAVLKYASNVTLTVNTPVTWQGDHFRPIALVSKDNNSVGQAISGSTGTPTNRFASIALNLNAVGTNTNFTLQNMRITQAQTAIAINGNQGHVLSHVQTIDCGIGISATNADYSLRNALFNNVQTNFALNNSTSRVEHLTTDIARYLNSSSGQSLFLTNCLVVAVTNPGNYISQNVGFAGSGAGVFTNVGAGSHYLIAGSTNRAAGTASISAGLTADFLQMTTYPPLRIANQTIGTTTNLFQTAGRNTGVPDVGYHYDPLDYYLTNVTISGTLNFSNGAVVGVANLNGLPFSGTINGSGTPLHYSRLLPAANVQEQVVGGVNWLISITNSAQINLNFADLPAMGGSGGFCSYNDAGSQLNGSVMTIRNSTLRGSQISLMLGETASWISIISVNLTNNLIDRSQIMLRKSYYYSGYWISAYNNLFHGGTLSLTYYLVQYDHPYWYFYDNLFDAVIISQSGETYYTYNGHNGYMVNTTKLVNAPGGDPVIAVADYQSGPLGSYYYPTNGGRLSQLINAGSRIASAAGLYHFTTQTNQAKETNSVVDIGYHYMAVDGNGNPVDSDGDGVPDYLEDANGNGLVDTGESSWILNSYNGLSFGTGLQVFTPLK